MALRIRRWWKIDRVFGHRRTVYGSARLGGGITFGGRVRGVVSPAVDATLDERIAFLLRQFERMQERLDDLEGAVTDMPARWRQDVAAVRVELDQRIERRLSETQERYLALRRLGLVCLLVAIVLLSASNL